MASVPALSLSELRDQEEFQTEKIPCSVMDVDAIDAPLRFHLMIAAVTVVVFLLASTLPPEWENLRMTLGMVAGVGSGVMLGFMLPLLRVPRRLVDPVAVYRKFGPAVIRSAGVRIPD